MAAEKALALVLRTTDWSETSRIATLWTREFGRVRVLAKGGRRLKSNFETALDLLTLCTIVFLRKSTGSLDLLTEAQVVRRFPALTTQLPALYAGYYVAELLSDWTEDFDPHPGLFDEALRTLGDLGASGVPAGPRLFRFEWQLLCELGYRPVLEGCAVCGRTDELTDGAGRLSFGAGAGGLLCRDCQPAQRLRRSLSLGALHLLRLLAEEEVWRRPWAASVRAEVRQLLNEYVSYWMGRRPRLLPYLES